jgi:prolyl oligopeptidase
MARHFPGCALAMRLPSCLALAFLSAASAVAADYPLAPRGDATDTYHGVTVTDPYRVLEENDNPAVVAWQQEESALARRFLDGLSQRPRLRERFAELNQTAAVRYFDFEQARGVFFALKRQPPKNQAMLVAMRAAGDSASERVLVDPNSMDAKGGTAIDWYAASPDGRFVAVSLSEGGSERGSARVYEVASGKALAEVVPRVQYPTGGGSIAWKGDGSGFYYTRYPAPNERPAADLAFFQQVWFHKLGTPVATDAYVLGKEFPRIAETALQASRDGRYVLASVNNGDGGDVAFWLRGQGERWTRVADFADHVKSISLGLDGMLYARSHKGASRGQVIAMPMDKPVLAEARVIVPESDGVIVDVVPTARRIYVTYMAGGPSEIRMFDLAGKALGVLPSEAISTNSVGERLEGDEILVGSVSYVTPRTWYRYSPASGKLVATPWVEKSPVSFADAEVVREMATSKDGTRVPVNIVMRKGTKLDGNNPVLLYGYGGYGLSQKPFFSERVRVWLDAGGIYADVNLRGGGEFGEAWHLAGNLERKQNVFDDMIAAARHLVDRKYTKPERLAAMGGSNGGLLMGAILTQRPDLFRAIVSQVGIYDLLRVELTENGAFNVTEFGTVKDKSQFDALHAYSPYHHVTPGTAYPAVLLTAGLNDGRVDPWQSRKMAARLQGATTSGRPVLFLVDADSGHGIGTSMSKRVEQNADVYAFLMSQLAMTPR